MGKKRAYCPYCDVFLVHNSLRSRRDHNEGWRHIAAFQSYYARFFPQQIRSGGLLGQPEEVPLPERAARPPAVAPPPLPAPPPAAAQIQPPAIAPPAIPAPPPIPRPPAIAPPPVLAPPRIPAIGPPQIRLGPPQIKLAPPKKP
jgi:hypothetical protein